MPGKFAMLLSILIHVGAVASWFYASGGHLRLHASPDPQNAVVDVELEEEVVADESLEVREESDVDIEAEGDEAAFLKALAEMEKQEASDQDHPQEKGEDASAKLARKMPKRPPAQAHSTTATTPQPPAAPVVARAASEPDRIRYAAAPSQPTQLGLSSDTPGDKTNGFASPLPSATIARTGARDQRGLSIRVGDTRVEGFQAPGFTVNLPVEQMDQILSAGHGCLMVFCQQERYVVEGTIRTPARVIPASASRLGSFSERALPVQNQMSQPILRHLKWQYAVPDDQIAQSQVCLLLSNQLDHLILDRQQAAARLLHCQLEDIRQTVGCFEFKGQYVCDYRIHTVVLNDDRHFALENPNAAGRAEPQSPPEHAVQ